jgi:hypothetical protein
MVRAVVVCRAVGSMQGSGEYAGQWGVCRAVGSMQGSGKYAGQWEVCRAVGSMQGHHPLHHPLYYTLYTSPHLLHHPLYYTLYTALTCSITYCTTHSILLSPAPSPAVLHTLYCSHLLHHPLYYTLYTSPHSLYIASPAPSSGVSFGILQPPFLRKAQHPHLQARARCEGEVRGRGVRARCEGEVRGRGARTRCEGEVRGRGVRANVCANEGEAFTRSL